MDDHLPAVYLETFGCQMNRADSEIVLGHLQAAGYRAVNNPEDAGVIIYNTCSVRDSAEAKIRGRLDGLARIKRERPDLRVVVMGCMAQRLRETMLERWPHLDAVIGTDQFPLLPALLSRITAGERLVHTDRATIAEDAPPAAREDGINAWVPIMRGCNYRCTYCIVPTTRGSEQSRDPAAIEREVRHLVERGFPQVTLLGQTVDAYGKTRGDGTTLAGLLRRLHAIDGLKRLRFVTSHPKDISDELLDTMAELPRVAKHLHVPAQSGSDRILRLMGRRYTRDDYLRLVERARQRIPMVELLTDMIVGFPRESEEDFQASVSLMEAVRFDGAFVFQYSPRPGTGAARLEDTVPTAVKKQRCNDLLTLQLGHQTAAHQALHGQELEILVEGPSKNDADRLMGRSLGNRMVMIPRHDANGASRDQLIGALARARIEASTSLTLFGDLVT